MSGNFQLKYSEKVIHVGPTYLIIIKNLIGVKLVYVAIFLKNYFVLSTFI